MNILGINYGGHDTSAALLKNGKLVAACEEERYCGDKHTRDFPKNAISDCLKIASLEISDIDVVSFSYKPSILLKASGQVRKMRRDLPSEKEYIKILKEQIGYEGDVDFNHHHLCHVASSYYPSGFDTALLYSNDGIGETHCSMMAMAVNGEIKVIHKGNPWPNSLGLFYSAITFYLGWKPMCDEGIVMGLAPLGNSRETIPNTDKRYIDVFREMVHVNGYDIEINKKWFSFHKERDKFVSDEFISIFGPLKKWEDEITENHKNIAAALQDRLEEIVLEQLTLLRKEYEVDKLCISGGVGLNCSLNGKIESKNIFDEIFVPPASGDNGTSIGAAYLSLSRRGKVEIGKYHDFFLGHRQTDEEIKSFLDKEGIAYVEADESFSLVSQKLEEGKIIGWLQGGAEFGPRALGNRSILAKPFPSAIKDHVNARVKFREAFRPFAPSVLAEEAREWFEIRYDSPHMLRAVQCREDKVEDIGAVIHVDNSARVQTVHSLNPRYRTLIETFNKQTGYPILLNTSFNVKGQPIVNDCEDAYKCFMSTNIDVLVVGKYIVEK